MHSKRWIVLLPLMALVIMTSLMALPARMLGASAAATATPTPAPTAEADLAALIDGRLTKIAAANLFDGAVLVAKDGEVLLSKGYGTANRELDAPMTAQTKFRIGTLTSLFTALATMRLVQDEAISLDDSICAYVDDCPKAWQPITIDHLLARTSGLRSFDSIPESATVRKVGATPKRLLAIYRDIPLQSQPGKHWSYSEMNDILLGMVIGKVGAPYGAFLKENILDPLGMADTGLDNGRLLLANRASGYADPNTHADSIDIATWGAAGAIYSTVEDLYRLAQGVTDNTILSDTVSAQMAAPHTVLTNFYGRPTAYGYGWFLNDFDGHRRVIGTGGINGYMADMHLFPDDHVVVILLGNRDDKDTYPTAELIEGWIFGKP